MINSKILERIRADYYRRQVRMDDAKWEENKHPRAKDGKFTSGSGSNTGESTESSGEKTSKPKDYKALKERGYKLAEKFRKSDAAKIEKKKEFVRQNLGTEAKPFKREATNLKKVMSEGGVNEEDAKRCASIAEGIVDKAVKLEPEITKDIVGAVKELGGTMYGLDFRLKQSTSMGRKIASDAREDGIDFNTAGSKVRDAIRYTAVFDNDNFTEGYEKTKAKLESLGYTEVRCRNYYKTYREDPDYNQKAVQCVFQNKDGQMFELQFHTVDSQGTKEVSHPMYEEHRAASTSQRDKHVLNKRMRNIYETVKDPRGVLHIKSHG